MLARCSSASLLGLEARPVTVEVDLAPGLPGIQLVGLPDKAIQESRERVRSALRNSGFRGPLVRVVVNLAPADLRKEGPAFDLPIALALLVASGQLDRPRLDGLWCAGELGLDGRLRPCRGVLAVAELAAREGADALVVPPGNADEAAFIPDLVVHTAPDLHQLVEQLNGTRPNQRICRHRPSPPPQSTGPIDAPGQAGKALALAASGGHHLLLVGPPGCGKSRLAHQLPQLLPPLEPEEALTIARIRSVAGEQQEPLNPEWIRPFRAPHHSCSAAALLGGGHNPRPGEVSLAHGGVLFLDELAEFPRAVLDQLRQPLEEGVYRLSRARLKASFPAGITLVAATNPCPCGGHGDRDHGCRCSYSQRQRYWQRLSGPLLDRLDLQLRLDRRSASAIRSSLSPDATNPPEPWIHPDQIRAARRQMIQRNPHRVCNRDLSAHDLGRHGQFTPSALQLWERLVAQRGLSTRSGIRLLRVARTVADLNASESVGTNDLAEASGFRCADLLQLENAT